MRNGRREVAMVNGGTLTPMDPGKRPVGRPPGVRNRTTNILKEAILLAAETTGMPEVRRNPHGEIVEVLETGERGLVGYLIHIALHEPRSFVALLGRVLPLNVNANVLQADETATTGL